MRRAVSVVHPGVQHSRELARALHEGGMLARFVTSSAGQGSGATWLPGRIQHSMQLRAVKGVPRDLVRTFPYPEALAWLAGRMMPVSLAQRIHYATLAAFDRVVAPWVVEDRPHVVVAVENSALETFKAAKEAGALCVLDAAAVHYRFQPPEQSPVAVQQRKEAELRLADRVVVLSKFARDTYAAAGYESSRIAVISPGVWLPEARPSAMRRAKAGGMRFLFAGNVTRLKGVDLLLRAFSRVRTPHSRLLIAGSVADASLLPKPMPMNVEVLGRLTRQALFDEFARADVLVLPSRADGFGFVVAEAMASGLPVIVSSNVGAKDLVEDGRSGWIFQSDNEDHLAATLELVAQRRHELEAVGRAASEAVSGATWERYRANARGFYAALLGPS